MPQQRKHVKKCNTFPHIDKKNHTVQSPQDPHYNCIAFAANDTMKKWWPAFSPDAFWPASAPYAETPDAFVKAFETLGYAVCNDDSFTPGLEKIALYTLNGRVKHAARQVGPNAWVSKLGGLEDIEHKKLAITGPGYGQPTVYLARKKTTP